MDSVASDWFWFGLLIVVVVNLVVRALSCPFGYICQLYRMRVPHRVEAAACRSGSTWFATIHVARQPQISSLPLICLYIHSLLSLVYIDQNAIIECRVCVLDRDQPESHTGAQWWRYCQVTSVYFSLTGYKGQKLRRRE